MIEESWRPVERFFAEVAYKVRLQNLVFYKECIEDAPDVLGSDIGIAYAWFPGHLDIYKRLEVTQTDAADPDYFRCPPFPLKTRIYFLYDFTGPCRQAARPRADIYHGTPVLL
jgi:hypothetical protein